MDSSHVYSSILFLHSLTSNMMQGLEAYYQQAQVAFVPLHIILLPNARLHTQTVDSCLFTKTVQVSAHAQSDVSCNHIQVVICIFLIYDHSLIALT